MKTVGHPHRVAQVIGQPEGADPLWRGEDGEAVGLPDPEGVIADQRLDALLDRPDGALGRIGRLHLGDCGLEHVLSSIRSPGVSRVTGVVRR